MAKYSQKQVIDLYKRSTFNCYSFNADTKKCDSAITGADMVDAMMFAVNQSKKGNLVLFLSEEGVKVAHNYEFKNLALRVSYDMVKEFAVSMYSTGVKEY